MIFKGEIVAHLQGERVIFKREDLEKPSQTQSQQVVIHQAAPVQLDPQPSEDVSKIQKILDGLDERLALGEIDQETYNKLSKKWQDKL